MHTVARRGNRWDVLFIMPSSTIHLGERELIMSFDRAEDAFSLCSYLNGGKHLNFGPNGWIHFREQTEPYSEKEMKAND